MFKADVFGSKVRKNYVLYLLNIHRPTIQLNPEITKLFSILLRKKIIDFQGWFGQNILSSCFDLTHPYS